MRILIAEDDMVSRKILVKLFENHGELKIVVNGVEAIDDVIASIKESRPYDLICLDIMMPRVDGISVLKNIRTIEKQYNSLRSRIIMTTALDEESVVKDAFDHGADAYASKPLDIEKLNQVLRNFEMIK